MSTAIVARLDDHPLATALLSASEGRFPPADGVVEIVAPDAVGACAVVELTGHSFVLTHRSADDELFGGIDAFGGATDPRLLVRLAARDGWIGSLDLVLVRRAGPPAGDPLPATDDDLDDHPRVRRARAHRRDVRVFGDRRGVVCIGRGLVGRTELSVELTEGAAGHGLGRELVGRGLATLDDDEPVFVQVAPGNAASVRMFLACGFVPIGSEVLLRE